MRKPRRTTRPDAAVAGPIDEALHPTKVHNPASRSRIESLGQAADAFLLLHFRLTTLERAELIALFERRLCRAYT